MKKYTKCLFLTEHELDQSKGISKKIISQVAAIENQGFKTWLLSYRIDNKKQVVLINNEVFFTLGRNYQKMLYNNGIFYSKLLSFVKLNGIDCMYIRYTQFVDLFFLKFLFSVHAIQCTIFMEIPTYPYDGEFRSNGVKNMLVLWKDKLLRPLFRFAVDRIVTFSVDKKIFGIPCVNISNAVDENSIPLADKCQYDDSCVRMLGVANVNFWHGYDRLIKGINEYYSQPRSIDVEFVIVGDGNITVSDYLHELIKKYNLEKCVKMVGPKSGKELDEYFAWADIAIGSLGCHRKNIVETKTLKNVEYAMRGLPIIYSEKNNDFDNMDYVLKVSANDNPVNVDDIISFMHNNNFSPSAIRQSVQHLTWNNQMKNVFQNI